MLQLPTGKFRSETDDGRWNHGLREEKIKCPGGVRIEHLMERVEAVKKQGEERYRCNVSLWDGRVHSRTVILIAKDYVSEISQRVV